MAALNEGKLGDYRGLLCYNTRWDSFFTGGITVGVFATSTVVTIALYLAAAALIAKTNRKAGTNLDSSSDMYKRQKSRLSGAPRLLLLRGLLLVGTFFASWINFVFAILIPAHGGVSTLTYEMVASLGISLQPIIHTVVLLQPAGVRRRMFERLLDSVNGGQTNAPVPSSRRSDMRSGMRSTFFPSGKFKFQGK